MDAVTNVPVPVNEPNLTYAPGTPERVELEAEIAHQSAQETEIQQVIGGERSLGAGELMPARKPHGHAHILGRMSNATSGEVQRAIEAARSAAPAWRAMSFDERAAVLL